MIRLKKSKKSSLNRYIFFAGLMGIVYFIVEKFDNRIIYWGFSEYAIYTPIILTGFVFISQEKFNSDFVLVDWFFKFVLSLMLFFVPALTLFNIGNYLYVNKLDINHEYVKIERIVAGRKQGKIFLKWNNERQIIYIQRNQARELIKSKKERDNVYIEYKKGLFGTFIIQKVDI